MKPLKFLLSLVILFCVACEPDVIGGQKPSGDDVNDTLPVAQYGLEYLYDMSALAHITITVTEDDWNDFLSYYDQNPHNEEYILASFKYEKNGEIFGLDSIGIRLRGNTSRRRPEGNVGEQHRKDGDWHHAHFGVKFDEFVELIVNEIPCPDVDEEGPFQMLVSNIDYDEYTGRIAVGKIQRGSVKTGMPLVLLKRNRDL